MRSWMISGCVLIGALLVGCRSVEPPPFPVWAPPTPELDAGGTPFRQAAQAALNAEEATEKYARRVSFTPGQKEAIILKTRNSVARLPRKFIFEFRPHRPFEVSRYQSGWRVMGLALAWRIENACLHENYNAAVYDTILATRFGFQLTGGDALDASLGDTIVSDARRAIAPSLPKMGAGQLRTLSAGIKNAYDERPSLSKTLDHELQNMLMAVQFTQDAYQKNELEPLRKKLGPDARDAIQYLHDLRAKDREERPGYFSGFADEANRMHEFNQKLASLPTNSKEKQKPALREMRPWRRFAKLFFGSGRTLLEQHDDTLARTRLLVLECELMRSVKVAKRAPANLNAFSKEFVQDPLTGETFIYRSVGETFAIYSVGTDGKDDGGDTDETFSVPDLRLERPNS